MDPQQAEVWAFVQALNRAWTVEGAPEKLTEYFAQDMIAITPDEPRRREGRAACVAGWTGFARAATIARWSEENPKVHLFADGHAAVVAYDFTIDFAMDGHPVHLRGRDLMTLEKRGDRWWLVADHYAPMPG
jgi:ketosteroid isomerase-like protein